MTSREWQDGPSWLIAPGVEEQWDEKEWRQWEKLRERFEELGVELQREGEEDELRGVHAYWKSGGWVGAETLGQDANPLHEVLHRLVNKVADARRQRIAGMEGTRMPPLRRGKVADELRRRLANGEPLSEVLAWLATTETTVGEAVEMVEGVAGLSRRRVEEALADHPDWGDIVRLMGGIHGEHLPS